MAFIMFGRVIIMVRGITATQRASFIMTIGLGVTRVSTDRYPLVKAK